LRLAIILASVVGVAVWHLRDLDTLLLPAPLDQVVALRAVILAGLAGTAALVVAITAIVRPATPFLADGRAEPTAEPEETPEAPAREAAAASAPQALNSEKRGTKIKTWQATGPIRQEVPNIGVLMKTYLIADWLLLRLFGAMLLFMAYMIFITPEDYLYKIGGMLYGIKPSTVMYVYLAWGAMMLLPAILPNFISRPKTVIGGAGKAAVLVFLAIVILPGIDAAIDLYAGKDYRAAFHSSVPGFFKGISGLAVFSAMAIALFRNLSRNEPVVTDGMGKKTQRFSADDLRALRSARMQG
jgi:hypothetical protein